MHYTTSYEYTIDVTQKAPFTPLISPLSLDVRHDKMHITLKACVIITPQTTHCFENCTSQEEENANT